MPFPPPGDLPDSGVEPTSLTSPALADGFFTPSPTWEAPEFSKSTSDDFRRMCHSAALLWAPPHPRDS